MQVLRYDQLFDDARRSRLSAETRAAIATADVIVAFDKSSQLQFTVFGTPALEETLPVGAEISLSGLQIEFERRDGQLENLLNLVQSVKRGHDRFAGDE
jgi:hypothetical protein